MSSPSRESIFAIQQMKSFTPLGMENCLGLINYLVSELDFKHWECLAAEAHRICPKRGFGILPCLSQNVNGRSVKSKASRLQLQHDSAPGSRKHFTFEQSEHFIKHFKTFDTAEAYNLSNQKKNQVFGQQIISYHRHHPCCARPSSMLCEMLNKLQYQVSRI